MPAQQSSVRLVELGPRMTLDLIKIEEGLMDGEVMYHKLVTKTDEEKKAIRLAREKRKKEKEKRRKEQEKNVKSKMMEKEKHKQRSLKGMRKVNQDEEEEEEDDDDAKYFEEEVGQKPESDLFDTSGKTGQKRRRKMSSGRDSVPNIKRFRKDKKKRERNVFNNQGVGPNFNKKMKNVGPKVVANKFKRKRK